MLYTIISYTILFSSSDLSSVLFPSLLSSPLLNLLSFSLPLPHSLLNIPSSPSDLSSLHSQSFLISFKVYVSAFGYPYLYSSSIQSFQTAIFLFFLFHPLICSFLPSFLSPFSSLLFLPSFKVYVSVLTYGYLYSFQLSRQTDPACFIGGECRVVQF